MHMFTALFDQLSDAEAVQQRLKSLGIVDLDEGDVYSREHPDFDAEAYSTKTDKGIWGAPKMVFPPDEDRHLHEEHLRRGGYLLSVTVDDAEAARVQQLLEGSHAVDVEERERQYRDTGFVPPVSTGMAKTEEVIPVLAEELRIGKRQVDRGGVRVRAYTVEKPVSEQVRLREEHVEVERRPVNERVTDDAGLFQERTLEATATAEEAVVGKQARVVEELVVRKEVGQRAEEVRDTVRHTEVEIDRVDPDDATRKPI